MGERKGVEIFWDGSIGNVSAVRTFIPQETLDQAFSWMKYEAKPANAPTKAIPLLAATDPVNRYPIKVIVKNPAICHVTALIKSLIVLSIGASPRSELSFQRAISDKEIWTLCEFTA